jgi:hypothetical protein
MDIDALLKLPIDPQALSRALDEATHPERLAAVMAMSSDYQAALYDAVRGMVPITIADLVPPGVDALVPVVHWGRNTISGFRHFQKVMCRPDDPGAQDQVWGYNNQKFESLTGPGYFVAYDIDEGQVLVDYTRLPPHGAPGWPKVISNSARLSRWIYNNTKDTLRGVSRHVTIGRAARGGSDLPNWFVLCREDAAPADAVAVPG